MADVQAYLRGRSRVPRPASRPQQLAFEGPPGTPEGPAVLYLPSSEQFADYPQRILEVITELAEIEDRYAVDVLNEILREPGQDQPNGAAREAVTTSGAAPR